MAQSTSDPSRRLLVLIAFLWGCGFPAAAAVDADVSESYGKLPLHFEENRGQAHDDVRYISRGSGYVLFLTTAGEAVFVLPRAQEDRGARSQSVEPAAVLRMAIVDGNPAPAASALESLPGKVNYFIGKDPAKWRTNVPTHGKVRYRNVYPGIDLVYYGSRRQVEYDFIVAPGADPQRIVLDFQGADRVEINGEGDLVLHEATGPVRLRKPYAYQDIGGRRQEIAGRYALHGGNRVGFDLGAYDRGKPLIIDPVFLFYSTYLGGERGESVAVDRQGHAYVTGFSGSTDFTTTPGAFQPNAAGDLDVFVTKLNRAGTRMLYSTFIGGGGTDRSRGIAVDRRGNAYVTGATSSTDFPTTAAAFETTCGANGSCAAAFAIKLNPSGSALAYSTYLGGRAGAAGFAVAVDDSGSAYVAGSTSGTDFPTTPGAFQTTHAGGGDLFVTKLDPSGSGLIYSTYLGGEGQDNELGGGIAVDANGNAYVAGHTKSLQFPTTPGAFQRAYGGGLWDGFVSKLSANGSALVYSTYLGGDGFDQVVAIALGDEGDAYVTGRTAASSFPVANALQGASGGGFDAFVTRLHPSGSRLIFSTYLGGSSAEEANGIAVGPLGNVVVAGVTNSMDYPTTPDAFQPAHAGGDSTQEGFVTKLRANGTSLVYSTYLGGTGYEVVFGVAVGPAGNAYVTGETGSPDFPTTPGAPIAEFRGFFQDGFVSKLARRERPETAPGALAE